jgi:tripartite ATP-independent transporter DctM subunit
MDVASWVGPVMFMTMVAALLLGFPVGLTLIVHGAGFTVLNVALGEFPWGVMQAHGLRVYGLLFNDVLLAIPFFTLMGMVLEKSGIAEEMLSALADLLRGFHGGLAVAVIFVGTILAATTGVIQASIIAMGIVALPAMILVGYNHRLTCGIIAASGTLAQLIPPSLVLIVMADATGIPIFKMYERALVPGLILAALYCVYALVAVRTTSSELRRSVALPSRTEVLRAFGSLAAPFTIIAITMGSALVGIATPTESGGFGALASLALAFWRKRLDLQVLRKIVDTTTVISCCALFIMIGATFFTLPFNAMGGKEWIGGVFSHLPGGQTGFLIVAILLIFVLAFFLDFFEIAFLALPLLLPTAVGLGIDPAWFAVLVCIALQTSFMHPPFGVAIYTLRSVAPSEVKSADIYWGAVPFILIQLGVALLIIMYPDLAFDFSDSATPRRTSSEVEEILRKLQ